MTGGERPPRSDKRTRADRAGALPALLLVTLVVASVAIARRLGA